MKHKLFIPIFQEGKYVFQFTKEELEKLLDETYDEGHKEGYNEGYKEGRNAWSYPYVTTPNITNGTGGAPTYDSNKTIC
jgi:hypothetical protein